jgi:hypothetical protein
MKRGRTTESLPVGAEGWVSVALLPCVSGAAALVVVEEVVAVVVEEVVAVVGEGVVAVVGEGGGRCCNSMSRDTIPENLCEIVREILDMTVGSSSLRLTPSFFDKSGANFHTQKAAMNMRMTAITLTTTTNTSMPSKLLRRLEEKRMPEGGKECQNELEKKIGC